MEEIQQLEHYKKIISDNDIRLTSQRQVILDVLFSNRKSHLTVKEIWAESKKILPKIGSPTVYRTVSQFERIVLLYKLAVSANCYKYQLHEDNKEHKHFICTQCGSITDVFLSETDTSENQIENKYHVWIENQNIIYYGLCGQCFC